MLSWCMSTFCLHNCRERIVILFLCETTQLISPEQLKSFGATFTISGLVYMMRLILSQSTVNLGRVSRIVYLPLRKCVKWPLLNAKNDFCAHLSAAQLVSSARFADFNRRFPENYLDETVESYPFLKKDKLRSELKVLYERPDLQKSSGTMGIFNFIVRSGLEKCFSETCTLLQIILTIPMSTAEAERCFSTLKRVKTFLRNSMADSRMNALAMLSIEKDMIRHTSDFNEKVINVFQTLKERRAEFSYK